MDIFLITLKTVYLIFALGVSIRTEIIPFVPDTVDAVVGKSLGNNSSISFSPKVY